METGRQGEQGGKKAGRQGGIEVGTEGVDRFRQRRKKIFR